MADISFNKDEVIFMSLFFFFLLVTLGIVIFYPNQNFIDSEFTDFLNSNDKKKEKPTDKQEKPVKKSNNNSSNTNNTTSKFIEEK